MKQGLGLLLIILIICFSTANAQECILKGKVINTRDSTVQLASVVAYNKFDNLVDYSTTDKNGFYSLSLKCGETFKIEISHLSYQKDSLSINLTQNSTTRDIQLLDKFLMLDAVTKEETMLFPTS